MVDLQIGDIWYTPISTAGSDFYELILTEQDRGIVTVLDLETGKVYNVETWMFVGGKKVA